MKITQILRSLSLFGALLLATAASAQTKVSGTITDANSGEPLTGVNVVVKGSVTGTITDYDGNFSLDVKQMPPFVLTFSFVGYEAVEQTIESNPAKVNLKMKEAGIMGSEVVVSASRRPESILRSPVSIEKMDVRMLQNSASPSFYDAIENMKGVQMGTNSLTFKAPNTRGFASFANTRFVQVIDGMDNAAPGLNFSVGNIAGISELDVNSVELVPGAASALYGPNAFNGILFLNSKDPFVNTGLSVMLKSGVTQQDSGAGTNPFGEFAIRYAHNFDDKFALKINFSALQGTDWQVNDYSDMIGRAEGDPGFDAVNRYGDEIATTLTLTNPLTGVTTQGLVARTGYNEIDIIDDNNGATSYKFDAALHYRIASNAELLYNYRYGSGQTVYQGANRYRLRNFSLQQHKVELKGNNYFLRAYATLENAGDSYDTRFAAWNINRAWKSDQNWFTDYSLAYQGALLNPLFGGAFAGIAPAPGDHDAARAFADNNLLNNASLNPIQLVIMNQIAQSALGLDGWSRTDKARAEAGSAEFIQVRDNISLLPDLRNGSKFIDRSRMYHVEGNYNFADMIKFMEVQVGGSFRQFILNSEGTIFNDGPNGFRETIPIEEYGAYVQASKGFLEDEALKLTASLRYDKNVNFDGRFTPRASAVYTFGSDKQHNLRGSFQTGFRNPATQDQFIALDLGVATLLGGAPVNVENFTLDVPLFNTSVTGTQVYDNSYTVSSATAFSAAVAAAVPGLVASGLTPQQAQQAASVQNAGLLEKANVAFVQPERVTAYEIGYKGVLNNKLYVDAFVYYNQYQDFQAQTRVITPLFGDVDDLTTFSGIADLGAGRTRVFQLYSNATGDVFSLGAGLSLEYSLPQGYKVGGNYTYASIDVDDNADPDLIPGFNTPENRFNVYFGNPEVFKNFGFQVNFRYSDSFMWQASFGDGMVDSYNATDLQVSYRVPKLKSTLKLGASNIFNQEYQTAFGAAFVGRQAFISIVYDEMFR